MEGEGQDRDRIGAHFVITRDGAFAQPHHVSLVLTPYLLVRSILKATINTFDSASLSFLSTPVPKPCISRELTYKLFSQHATGG